MELRPYEILSHLIPGYIIYAVLWKLYPEVNFDYDALPSLGIAFVLGYFANTLSSLLEPLYFVVWGGKPSTQLLKGKKMSKIILPNREGIKNKLNSIDVTDESLSDDDLFNLAVPIAHTSENSRLGDFNSAYVLSRAVLTCVIFLGLLAIINYYKNWEVYLSVIVLVMLTGYRAKQRGFYYAKEVLNTFYQMK